MYGRVCKHYIISSFSALTLWLGGRKGNRPVKSTATTIDKSLLVEVSRLAQYPKV